MVYHDYNMKRTTGFDGFIKDHDLTQIRSLDNGSFFSDEFKGEKIPLFEEVLQLLGDRVYYDIELKTDSRLNSGLEKKVNHMILDFNLENRVLVSSFNPLSLKRFSKENHKIPRSIIYSNTKDVPSYLRKGEGKFLAKPNGMKPDHNILDEKLIQKIKKKYHVMTWTVDDEDIYKQLVRWKVDGICTNRGDYFASGKFID